jgi:hypothetical protein
MEQLVVAGEPERWHLMEVGDGGTGPVDPVEGEHGPVLLIIAK